MENSEMDKICEEILENEIEDNEDEEVSSLHNYHQEQRKKIQGENQKAINKFINNDKRTFVTGITPNYYGELLTWALHQYLQRKEWSIVNTLGYKDSEPIYTDVDTGGETVNLLVNGHLLAEKDGSQYVITIFSHPRYSGYLQIEGALEKKKEMQGYIDEIMAIVKEENFYRGKTLRFTGRIHLIKSQERNWDSIILDEEIKQEIQSNTTDFLRHCKEWNKYGIPLKRGVLLAGEPGVGKTIICKALISEAAGITCITTDPYALNFEDYITELYKVAEDLKPSIVFIEDIDFIAQSRMDFGTQSQPSLLTLLDVLDGLEEQKEIVTVATTNCLGAIDKALSERPSRFDRVIKLNRPTLEQRRELILRLCNKIPLSTDIQEYIAHKADNCTPAQIQEIVFSLVIQHLNEQIENISDKNDVDNIISKIINKNNHRLGFSYGNNHNDSRQSYIGADKLNQQKNES